jgi:molecular chaperone GrpE
MENNKETLDQNIEEETLESEINEEKEETKQEETTEETSTQDQASEESSKEQTDAQSDGEGDGEIASEVDKKKKKGFRKKDKKDEQIEELNDKYQRLFAEFQNYRNRSEKEKSAMFDMGARNIIEKFLPVIDNFERGLAALSEEDLGSPVGQGMDLIYKQMAKALADMGVEAIEAQGKEFDPELHNAVMQVENDELEENTVAQELQKGYTYKGTVIRHSMVAVTK